MRNNSSVASLIGQYGNPLEAVGSIATQFLARADKDRDRADKLAAEARQQANWDKSFSLQKAAADMQAEKFGIDKATTQGNILANKDLQNATQGLITPEQADVILAAYNKNPKADVVAMQNAAKAQYEASPTLQRQYISGVNIDQGPQEVVVGMDADGNPITKEVQGDVSVAQELKNKMLGGYDTRIAADKLAAAQLASDELKYKQQIALENMRNANDIAKVKLQAKLTPKDDYYTKAMRLGLLQQELDATNPVKIAERKTAANEKLIKNKDLEQERFTKYLSQVPSTVDAYDYQQWKAAGMPTFSERGWSPFGTWGGR
jgi:LmbE family N-acetylglucosaminyl deacetylase